MSLSVSSDKTMNISSHDMVRIDQCSFLTLRNKDIHHDRGCSGCSLTKQSILEVLPFVFICKGMIGRSGEHHGKWIVQVSLSRENRIRVVPVAILVSVSWLEMILLMMVIMMTAMITMTMITMITLTMMIMIVMMITMAMTMIMQDGRRSAGEGRGRSLSVSCLQ